jgi:two-component sensor histidine kinase
VSLTISPVLDRRGRIVAASTIARDITNANAVREGLHASVAEKELLLKEIHHRVKNNLQVIVSLLKLERASVTDARALRSFEDSLERVGSMALLHEKLYQSRNLGSVDLADYLRQLALTLVQNNGINPDRVLLAFACEPVSIGMDYAVPCGLIANELISNALKHAFPGDRRGEITIELKKSAGESLLLFAVSDDGVGVPDGCDVRRTQSLGLQLVMLLVGQIHGTFHHHRGRGSRFEISFATSDRE